MIYIQTVVAPMLHFILFTGCEVKSQKRNNEVVLKPTEDMKVDGN